MALEAVRLGIRFGNALLFALCCSLIADIANRLVADSVRPSREIPAPRSAISQKQPTSWEERASILDRDLFDAQWDPVVPAPPEPEELEKTELRLELVGTIASPNREMQMATLWYKDEHESEVLRPGDTLDYLPDVKLDDVERRRVVLQNGGDLEELLLEDRPRRVSRASIRRDRAKVRRELRKRRRSIRNR